MERTVMDSGLIREGERLDDLQRGGLRILQRAEGFRFGTDAVLLADFAGVKKGDHVADMGTGTGVLPLLLSARAENTTFDAFEIQPDVADMAARSVRINGLEDRIRIHNTDCRDAAKAIGYERCHLVVTNPPYTREGAGLVSPEKTRALSRSDSDCSLEEWIAACSRVLKNGGRLCCVFPVPRFLELCDAMRAARMEPKRVRFVVARETSAPKLALAEGLKGGRPGLHVLPMLITHDAQGEFTSEMRRIYGENVTE
ncbi:MAG: tRNA1(Val) (adenine(37)-N6)-methyltransferase [Clostridia bacterium]|nr:tRNA1(Val) (adenine(37)-N6)-methyltransferase [Clostridia bacterium]